MTMFRIWCGYRPPLSAWPTYVMRAKSHGGLESLLLTQASLSRCITVILHQRALPNPNAGPPTVPPALCYHPYWQKRAWLGDPSARSYKFKDTKTQCPNRVMSSPFQSSNRAVTLSSAIAKQTRWSSAEIFATSHGPPFKSPSANNHWIRTRFYMFASFRPALDPWLG